MIPHQLDEVARQHAEMMLSSRRPMPSQWRSFASRARQGHDPVSGEFRNLRQRTGWTLVAIGLRIAAATSR
jgi:hypothetical protein